MRIVKTVTIILFVLAVALSAGFGLYDRLLSDTKAPVITCGEDTVSVSVNDPESALLAGVTARDDRDGDLTGSVTVGGVSKLIDDDTARVTYYVFDRADNMGSATRFVRYTDYRRPEITVESPLLYAVGENISVAERLKATDVIDGDITGQLRVSATDITANVEGTYQITVYVTNSMGDTAELKLPLCIRGTGLNEGQIVLSRYLVTVGRGEAFDPEEYFEDARLPSGRRVSISDLKISGEVDTETPGVYQVLYTGVTGSGTSLAATLAVIVE
ncbi:MAG: bacterial Ig-like domain-containing protein [Oscillospiraceae bacterium]|nr:bacterial Ig-like domain-containing protein [Oscillospiraceae bacterium]